MVWDSMESTFFTTPLAVLWVATTTVTLTAAPMPSSSAQSQQVPIDLGAVTGPTPSEGDVTRSSRSPWGSHSAPTALFAGGLACGNASHVEDRASHVRPIERQM